MNSRQIKRLAKELRIDRTAIDHARILTDAEAALEASGRTQTTQIHALPRYTLPRLVWAGGLAAALLVISSWLACLVLLREVSDLRHELARRDVAIARTDESATINLYLGEHQDVVAQTASLDLPRPQPTQMRVSRHDILYYEFLDDRPEFMRPGIIVRGPSAQREIRPPEAPAISNGRTLTLAQARETAGFDLISPPQLHPGYMLDQI
ncbi:MAG: hypothetical protein JSW66_14405, partial [Phycisphaerales bacterium]